MTRCKPTSWRSAMDTDTGARSRAVSMLALQVALSCAWACTGSQGQPGSVGGASSQAGGAAPGGQPATGGSLPSAGTSAGGASAGQPAVAAAGGQEYGGGSTGPAAGARAEEATAVGARAALARRGRQSAPRPGPSS